MKNMKKIFIIIILISALGISQRATAQEADATGFIKTYAQPGGMLSFDWIIGVPTGDMTDNFISDVSTRGFNMEYRYLFNDPISVGGGFSWQGFSQKYDRATYSTEGADITSTRFNYLYTFPLYVNFHYYPLKNNFIYPWVGINVGMYSIDKQDQIGRYYIQDKSWQFGFQPEIGALIRPNPQGGFGFSLKAKYNYILYNKGNFNNLAQLNLYLGVAFVF